MSFFMAAGLPASELVGDIASMKSEAMNRARCVPLVHRRLFHEATERAAPGEIALRERPVGSALAPRRIGKTLVLDVRRKLGGSGHDAAELGEEG